MLPGPASYPEEMEVKLHFDAILPSWTGAQLSRVAEYVRSRVDHHLGRRAVGSRLAANAQLIASNLAVLNDYSVLQQRFDANRSTIEFFWIVRALDRGLVPVDYRLRRALRGHPGRYADGDTSPWDFQQELLWHSALSLAGVEGIRAEEPDLTIEAGTERLAFAVKRVSSLKGERSDERSREAVRQIYRSGHSGVIILQLDPPELQLTSERGRIAHLDEMAERAIELAAMHEPEARVYGAIAYAVQGEHAADKRGTQTIKLNFNIAQRWVEPDTANFARLSESLASVGKKIAAGLAREVAAVR